MRDDQRVERFGIGQCAVEDLGICNNAVTVGEPHGACVLKKSNFRHFAPCAAFGQGGHWQDVDRRILIRARCDELKRLRRINRWQGVRPRHDGRHTTRCSCKPGRAEAFLMTFPRFADLHANVDDTGGEAFAFAVDNLCFGNFGVCSFQNLGNLAILNNQRPELIGQGNGINQPRVLQQHLGHAICPCRVIRPPKPSRPPAQT